MRESARSGRLDQEIIKTRYTYTIMYVHLGRYMILRYLGSCMIMYVYPQDLTYAYYEIDSRERKGRCREAAGVVSRLSRTLQAGLEVTLRLQPSPLVPAPCNCSGNHEKVLVSRPCSAIGCKVS